MEFHTGRISTESMSCQRAAEQTSDQSDLFMFIQWHQRALQLCLLLVNQLTYLIWQPYAVLISMAASQHLVRL